MLLYESEDALDEYFLPQIEQAKVQKSQPAGQSRQSNGANTGVSGSAAKDKDSLASAAKNNPGKLR